jgi:hypothetical protein
LLTDLGACHDLPLFSMTRPARGVFRAIATFARYVTPSAPKSLSISTRNAQSLSPASEHPSSMSGTAIPIPDGLITPSLTFSPTQSVESLPLWRPTFSRPNSTNDADSQSMHDRLATTPTEYASSTLSSDKSEKKAWFKLPRRSKTSETSSQKSKPMSVPPQHSFAVSGDDSGPRFRQSSIDADNKAKPGEAGHTSIYRGPNVSCCDDVLGHGV